MKSSPHAKSELLRLAEIGYSESLIRTCLEHLALSTQDREEVLHVCADARAQLLYRYGTLPPPEEETLLLVWGAHNPDFVRWSLSRLNWTVEEKGHVMQLGDDIRKTPAGEYLPICILGKQLMTSPNPTISWWAEFFLTLYSVELTEVEKRVLEDTGRSGNPQVEN